ncbi:MAG: hypothetical protein MUP36_01800 [Demequinaceae bacterium]|nr:hypothetical protein [Demequinaceae bacterium]
MTFMKFRGLVVTAAALLILGGCAVPGKGEPGIAAVYHDRVITEADISAVRLGLNELESGPNAGEDLTLLLIGPQVVAFAEDLGYGMTDEQIQTRADQWISMVTKGRTLNATITSGGGEVVRVIESMSLIMHDADGQLALIRLVQDIEKNAMRRHRTPRRPRS